MGLKHEPYLSVVVTARNDDHGGNLLGRMQTFVNAWLAQVKRHGLSSELIVVDWNPPHDRPPLMDVLKWPEDTGPCQVRFIQVPPGIHQTYRYADALPLYQMIAKNVALRRARGKFILATNIDILFSDELIAFIAEGRLEPGIMYRMDRHDVMPDVPVNGPLDAQLEYCRNHVIRVCAREGFFEMGPDGLRTLVENDIAARDSGISLGEGWQPIERYSPEEQFRWVDNDATVTITSPFNPPLPLVFDLEPGPGVDRQPFVLQVLDERASLIAESLVTGRSKFEVALPPSDSERQSFVFRVIGGGLPVPDDPRIMNFRVFQCNWDTSKERSQRAKAPPTESPVEQAAEPAPDLFQIDTPPVEAVFFPAPTPPVFQRIRRFWEDSGGILAAVRAARLYRLRSRTFAEKTPFGHDIFESGAGIKPGAGWYALENFKEETFRWANNDAELIIQAPFNPTRPLAIQIEPGPAVGGKAFELEVRDQAGEIVASAVVEKLRYLEIPLPLQAGKTNVFRLAANRIALPIQSGDPRILNFRLFWCGWPRSVSESTPDQVDVAATRWMSSLGAGLFWGTGWGVRQQDDSGRVFRSGTTGAELVVQPCDGTARGLLFEIEPSLNQAPIELRIKGHEDQTPAYSCISERHYLQVDLPLHPERTIVVELSAPGAEPDVPAFRIYGCAWLSAAPSVASGEMETESQQQTVAQAVAASNAPIEISPLPEPRDQPAANPANPTFLHTNTCGDFTLMARQHWFDLRGYPEFDLFSFHIDSVLCYAAHHGGARQRILRDPMRCYHIEHSLGSGWTPEGDAKMFERLRHRGIPWVEYSEVVTWISQMRKFNCTMIFNRENWGLADCEFPQRILD